MVHVYQIFSSIHHFHMFLYILSIPASPKHTSHFYTLVPYQVHPPCPLAQSIHNSDEWDYQLE